MAKITALLMTNSSYFQRTPKVTNQRNSTEAALIFVKMASVTGVTWILGIAANVQALSFLWYPYVVLNSLQGIVLFFSLISFVDCTFFAYPDMSQL